MALVSMNRKRSLVVLAAAGLLCLGLALPAAAQIGTTVTYTDDTDLVLTGAGVTLKILAGSKTSGLLIGATSFTPTIEGADTLTVRYPGPDPKYFTDGSSDYCRYLSGNNEYKFTSAHSGRTISISGTACRPPSSSGGGGGGGVTDTTPPVISGVSATGVTTSGATIVWTTDGAANSTVYYGLTAAYGITVTDAGYLTSHARPLADLGEGTLYHFKACSADPAGNSACSGDNTFTTADETPPVIFNVNVVLPSPTSALLTWSTNEPATSYVDYGLPVGPPYASTKGDAGLATAEHSVALDGLTADTTYHYRLRSADASAHEAFTGDATFRTPVSTATSVQPPPTETPAPPPPSVTATLIKGSKSAVYYRSAAGKRYLFPNQWTFLTWYPDFSQVVTVSDEVLVSIPMGGNVTYKPGVRMIKLTADPKVYYVSAGGVLRWVTTEAVAQKLYGSNWNKMIDDMPAAFFVNYVIGAPITEAEVGL